MSGQNVSQAMRPQGVGGRLFGVLMEQLSAANYRWVVARLRPLKPRTYLEIGFGTGRLAEMVAKEFRPARLVGLDPSALMVATAEKKLRRFARKSEIEFIEGDDTRLASLAGPFDAIASTHSFQFWRDPATTLAHVRALLAPEGSFVLVLRRHGSGERRVPNPISRSSEELAGARNALADAGFRIIADETLKTGSQGIVARGTT
jgi:ubiquinone/menaquinone biosynthesis C-methylase UbiE